MIILSRHRSCHHTRQTRLRFPAVGRSRTLARQPRPGDAVSVGRRPLRGQRPPGDPTAVVGKQRLPAAGRHWHRRRHRHNIPQMEDERHRAMSQGVSSNYLAHIARACTWQIARYAAACFAYCVATTRHSILSTCPSSSPPDDAPGTVPYHTTADPFGCASARSPALSPTARAAASTQLVSYPRSARRYSSAMPSIRPTAWGTVGHRPRCDQHPHRHLVGVPRQVQLRVQPPLGRPMA